MRVPETVALQTSTTKGNCVRRARNYNVCGWMSAILLAVLMPYCSADDTDNASKSQTPEVGIGNQLNVNWLYGAYIPKDVPLRSLTLEQRWKLYVQMTYTTPGIYIKTIAFAIRDQVTDIPHQWGDGGDSLNVWAHAKLNSFCKTRSRLWETDLADMKCVTIAVGVQGFGIVPATRL